MSTAPILHPPIAYKLFCVLKDKNEPLVVDIEATQSVANLKDVIKKKADPALQHVPAHELLLYRIDVKENEDDSITAQNLRAKEKELSQLKRLQATAELKDIFEPELPKRTIHIMVDVPSNYSDKIESLDGRNDAFIDGLQSSPDMGSQPPTVNEVTALLDAFVAELCPKIQEFFNRPPLPTWVPPGPITDDVQQFYSNLKIPVVYAQPNLLLHELGFNPGDYVTNLYSGRKHRILCNTSGSGKTRLLLEGLCQYWGFYFVATRGSDDIGSRDIEAMLGLMSRSRGWIHDIFTSASDHINILRNHELNNQIAHTKIKKVILARWIVFNAFIQQAKDRFGVLDNHVRREWLLFQLLPFQVDDLDPFLALINKCLVGVSLEVLESLLERITPQGVLGSQYNPFVDSFYYVMDEAQVAGRMYMGCFADADGEIRRPVLRPIIQCLTASCQNPIKVIVSGTGFSLELFKKVLASGIGKQSEWTVIHSTGDFVKSEAQRAYIGRYLPPAFLYSEGGESLTIRTHEWLRGRYRSTARFLEELITRPWIGNHPAAPNKLLNAYVFRLTNFTPLDAPRATLEAEPNVGPITIDTFEWDRIEKEKGLLKELSYSIYTYITQGVYPPWYNDSQSLVEYGIGRFVESTGNLDDSAQVTVVEPLALIGIVRYFASRDYTLDGAMRTRLQDNPGKAFEEVTLFAITKLLQGQEQLTEIFDFAGTSPDWAQCTGQIVVQGPSGVWNRFDIVTENPLFPGTGVAFRAKDPEDVEHWLKNGGAGWCIPGNMMGPDLLTWIELSNGERVLLALQAKCYSSGNVDSLKANVTVDAILSLNPDDWYSPLKKGNIGPVAAQQVQKRIDAMLGAINGPNQSSKIGKYNVLRVVSAYPLKADLDSNANSIQEALKTDDHPIARLRRGALASALATKDEGGRIVTSLARTLKLNRKHQ